MLKRSESGLTLVWMLRVVLKRFLKGLKMKFIWGPRFTDRIKQQTWTDRLNSEIGDSMYDGRSKPTFKPTAWAMWTVAMFILIDRCNRLPYTFIIVQCEKGVWLEYYFKKSQGNFLCKTGQVCLHSGPSCNIFIQREIATGTPVNLYERNAMYHTHTLIINIYSRMLLFSVYNNHIFPVRFT